MLDIQVSEDRTPVVASRSNPQASNPMTELEKEKKLLETGEMAGTKLPAPRNASLLDELCGSRAEAFTEDADSSAASQSVPPTGITDSGDSSDGVPCWVARAVYGTDNPKWLLFRAWLLGDAPAWFRSLYIRHGQRFAAWIAPRARVKSVIRRWMDSVLARRGV